MVPLWSLPAIGLLFFCCAVLVAKLRRLERKRTEQDGAAALGVAATNVIAGISCYAIGAHVAGGTAWLNAGAACFIAFPLLATVILRSAAQKHGSRPGSMAGVFLFSTTGVALVGAWTILHLKGPRGGWTLAEIFLFAISVVLILSGAACLGWWSGRSIRRINA